ncbi:uracil permease [Saccharata proteae CBS 121410]|uniref:Uracil permease n=1 Tax=Saccharata proteae CBS 121410 TaxID=1314787 RepID=A0A9P4LV68_9PEZI|nr:uracil permease [Saccharata proteae CBS 121410]
MAASALMKRKAQTFKRAFRSWDAFLAATETAESANGKLQNRNPWSNEDLDISPKKDWTWAWWDYAAFWWSYGFSTGVWTAGSSLVSVGLTWWQAILCIFASHTLGAIGMVMHSRSASTYHFGFPVASRICWGMYGAYFPVFVRVLVGTIWIGIQLVQGGYFTAVLFRAVFGKSFENLHNSIPVSSDITVQQLIGLLVFWVATLPLLSVPIPKVRTLFSIKSAVLPPIVIGLFIFCMLKGKGREAGTFSGTGTLKGSALAWTMLAGINSVMGKTSTSVVNQPDLARYARTQTAPLWSQLLALPIGNTLCATLGIFATSAIHSAWGELIWNPWDLSDAILDRYWSNGARAGIAVVSLGFLFSIVGSNLGANVIPWGADMTVLFPRFINIKRGMYLSYIIGVCICPWHILDSATSFLRFLGGYSIFLGPFVGIFLTDYLVIRKGNIYIPDLYTSDGRYWYRHGVSWRAAVAYMVSVVFPIPGFTETFGLNVSTGWLHVYQIGWLFTCVVSSVLYWLLCFNADFAREERKMPFEIMHRSGAEGPGPLEEATVLQVDAAGKV